MVRLILARHSAPQIDPAVPADADRNGIRERRETYCESTAVLCSIAYMPGQTMGIQT